MKKYPSKIAIFLFVHLAVSAIAQETITIDSKVDKSEILIGDEFEYSITIKHDQDVTVQPPSLAENLGAFEIRDYTVSPPVEKEGQVVEQTKYVLSTFETGEFEIPPLEMSYTIGNDSTARSIKTKSILINVKSLNPDEAGDIRDIKPPKTPPRDYTRLIILVGLLILAVAIALFLFYYFKRKKEGKTLLPKRQKPPRPAHEVALEALRNLVASDLLASGHVKQYYSELSEIVRAYIEDRFYIASLEMTTGQLLEEMKRQSMDAADISIMEEFLIACDLVKFAKYIPTGEESQQTTQLAFDYVEKTKLVPAEAQPLDDAESPPDAVEEIAEPAMETETAGGE